MRVTYVFPEIERGDSRDQKLLFLLLRTVGFISSKWHRWHGALIHRYLRAKGLRSVSYWEPDYDWIKEDQECQDCDETELNDECEGSKEVRS